MLGLFPKPYPDELIYSVLSRYFVRSGYNKYIFAAEDLFSKKTVRPSFEYFPPLTSEVVTELTKDEALQEIIVNYTMFPYHCHFIPYDRKQAAMQSLVNMDGNYHDMVLFPKRKETPAMRYCPVCVQEDRLKLGETYWHRLHQILELPVCPIHHCKIVETNFRSSGKSSPDLIAAEIVIPSKDTITISENEGVNELADYINHVFDIPIKMEEKWSIEQRVLSEIKYSPYRSPRGGICRITQLYEDFKEYYKGIIDAIPAKWQIHKILTGQRYDFFDVCLLCFFLKVAPVDVFKDTFETVSASEVFDAKILALRQNGCTYSSIAKEMNTSIDVIKNAAYINKRGSKQRARTGGKPGRRPIDWENLDIEMLPKVVETIDRLRSSEKPHRITVGGVAKLVGLKSKQIDKLPLCKAEIEKYCQTQEEFWAEKVLWAWRVLSKEGKMISIKQIRLLTNMSIEQIKRCMGELEKRNQIVFKEISIKL